MRRLAILPLLLAVACSTADYARIKAEKANPQFKGGAGQKTLVVVATADPAGRENLEDQFGIEGAKKNIEISASHLLIPNFKDVTKDALVDLVKQKGFDRVLIVRTIPGSWTSGTHSYVEDYYSFVGSGYMYPWPDMYSMWGSAYVAVYSPTDPPPSITQFHNLSVETVLYDSTDASHIWSCIAEITTSRYQGDAAKSYVATIVSRLRGKGLL